MRKTKGHALKTKGMTKYSKYSANQARLRLLILPDKMRSMAEMDFPIYRKYPNDRAFFKVCSPTRFEEISRLGKNYVRTEFEAKILPDRHMIGDMMAMRGGHWVVSDRDEYESVRARAEDSASTAV